MPWRRGWRPASRLGGETVKSCIEFAKSDAVIRSENLSTLSRNSSGSPGRSILDSQKLIIHKAWVEIAILRHGTTRKRPDED